MKTCSIDKLRKFDGNLVGLGDEDVSHKVMHIIVNNEFKMEHIKFGSLHIQQLVEKKFVMDENIFDYIKLITNLQYDKKLSLSTDNVFERMCQYLFSIQSKVQARQISTPIIQHGTSTFANTTPTQFVFPKCSIITTKIKEVAQLPKTFLSSTYFIMESSHELFDSICIELDEKKAVSSVWFLNMTTGVTHDFKVSAKILDYFKHFFEIDQNMKIHFCYLTSIYSFTNFIIQLDYLAKNRNDKTQIQQMESEWMQIKDKIMFYVVQVENQTLKQAFVQSQLLLG